MKPKSNGLFEVAGEKEKENGFCCMKLIKFLVRDEVKDWDEWHNIHTQASSGKCKYQNECSIYAKTAKKPKQLSLF